MTSKHETAVESESGQDALELLTADHQQIARLFAEFAALKGEGSDDAKSTLVARICQELIVHTRIEEEIFYPTVRTAIEDAALMDEALVEHAGAKELVAQLQAADPGDELYDARVTVLGEQIGHHVEEEEGSMFPQVRASGIDTASLGAALLKRIAELLAHATTLALETTSVNDDDADSAGRRQDAPLRAQASKPHRDSASKTGHRRVASKTTAKKRPAKSAR